MSAATPAKAEVRGVRAAPRVSARALRAALPALSLALIVIAIDWANPRAISYFGFNLMLNLAVPVAFATIAQMFIITVNDLDLSIGPFIGFCGCVVATVLRDTPALGAATLAGGVAVYALMGAIIHLRRLPSIVVTLGMLFVWQGLAILILPTPGGKAPDWLRAIVSVKTPFIPWPIVVVALLAALTHFGLMRTSYGAILRGVGGNPLAVARAGWSVLRVKTLMFALCGLFGVLASLALIGLTTSADATLGRGYTLQSIAGVILGGGEFVGGRVSPIGAVLGALTLTMAGSLLNFMRISPDWQVGAQGAILIAVLAARVLINRFEGRGR
jgi:ribose transport system permease protein